jgi:Mannosyltransferase (PIG-V)
VQRVLCPGCFQVYICQREATSTKTREGGHCSWRTVLDVCSALCLFAGDTVGGVLWPGHSVLRVSSLVWVGVVLVLVRHIMWPRPSILALVAQTTRARLGRQVIRRTWGIALSSRVTVIAVGIATVTCVGYIRQPLQFRVAGQETLNLPARFDAGWYLGIARHGYEWKDGLSGHRHNIAFFPAYPIAMRIAGDLLTIPAKLASAPAFLGGGDARMLWGGTLVSMLAFCFALLRIRELTEREGLSQAEALRGIALLAAYPFALFYSAAYSEGLFLLAMASTLTAWRCDRLRLAVVWGVVTGLARSNGWTLSAALLVDWIVSGSRRGRAWQGAIVALAPLAGAAAFSAFAFSLTGDAFDWIRAQEGWGRQFGPLAFLTRRIGLVRELGISGYMLTDPVDAAVLVCTIWMAVTAGMLAIRRQWMYATLIAGYLLPAVIIDLPATGRMTAVLFPAFFVWSKSASRRVLWATVGVFGLGQAFFAARFFSWLPPF